MNAKENPSHTATPWETLETPMGFNVVVDELIIASISWPNAKANAEHIVLCVNSHKALVNACHYGLKFLKSDMSHPENKQTFKAIIKYALAQAEGE